MSMTAHPEGSGHGLTAMPQTLPGQDVTGVLDAAAPVDPANIAAEVARIRSAAFAGRDADHLVSAEVDGEGIVTAVRLAATARTREPRVVEAAVLEAVAAAQAELQRVWHEAAARWRPEEVRHDESR